MNPKSMLLLVEKKAPVIASNGNKIHCMLPSRAYSGIVNVVIKDKDENVVTDYTFEEKS